jgi:hypothetical protein
MNKAVGYLVVVLLLVTAMAVVPAASLQGAVMGMDLPARPTFSQLAPIGGMIVGAAIVTICCAISAVILWTKIRKK